MVVVIPDKLPCSEPSSFIVSFNDPLPEGQYDFILIFKGVNSGRKSHGSAKRIDNKTLVATTGEHDVAETVKVSVSAVRAAHAKIKPFQMSFLTPFQMICSLLPDTGAVHSATALARCLKLPHSNVTVSVLDDELTALCQRTSVPDDLAFKPFFGASCRDTLLHFAAENGLHRFAAQLLGKSSGACKAFQSKNDIQLTPKDIANEIPNGDDIFQVFQEFEENAPVDNVPLVQTVTRQPMRKSTSFLAHVINETVKEDKGTDKSKNRRSLFKRWMPKRKAGDKKQSKQDNSAEQALSVSSRSQLMANKIPMMLPQSAASSCHASPAGSDQDDIEYSQSEGSDAESYLDIQDLTHKPEQEFIIPPPHSIPSFIGKAIVKRAYTPGNYDPPDSLTVKNGDLFDVIEVSGAWVWVASKGRVGRLMVSCVDLQIFDDEFPDYEDVDIQGPGPEMSVNDDDKVDYEPPVVENEDENAYVALYDWMPQMDDQIRFYTGDCIQIVEKKEDGWWLGHLEGKSFCQGYIPSNYIQKKVTVQAVDIGSHKSGSSTSGVSSTVVSSKVSGNSTTSTRSSVSNNSSQFSGVSSSSGGEESSKKTLPGLRQFQQSISKSKSNDSMHGMISLQFQSNRQSPELREKPKLSELELTKDRLLHKALLPPYIRQGNKMAKRPLSDALGEKPRSASSSPAVPQRGSNPSRPKSDIQERLRHGSPVEDLGIKKARMSNLQAPVSNPTKEKKLFNPTSETSCVLLDSPIFKKRAAAVAAATVEANTDHKQEGELCTAMPASVLQPSIPVQQNNNEQKWQALYKYTAADEQELSLQAGYIITVDMKSSNNEWLFATFNGNSGFVPANYVQRV